MSDCLGIYIENNLIKYAKVTKEREMIKVDAFGIKPYDKIDDALKQIILETYSFKTPISVNLSEETYNYFDIFAMLNKKDIENAIKTEFEFLCDEKGFNKNAIESRHFSVPSKSDNEKIRAIHISANKGEIARKTQQLEGYKLRTITPLALSITNLTDIKPKENIAIVNIEEKTSITLVVDGQIYKVQTLDLGMKEIFEKINLRENSYTKAYEICKNTTIYTTEGKNLQLEENEYLEDIMPTLYNIVNKTKEALTDEMIDISRVYISGTGSMINNVDLYFQEIIKSAKCEILKPYFIKTENVRVNIKDYIEVNSAIALALQGLGEGLKGVNFKELSFLDKIDLPTVEVTSKKDGKKKTGKSKINLSTRIDFSLKGQLDRTEKALLRLAGTLLMLIILYSIFSYAVGKQLEEKNNEANQAVIDTNKQIELANSDINRIKTRTNEYSTLVQNLQDINEKTTEKYRTKNSIPNLLTQIMLGMPKNVQITSIRNDNGTHIVINAQSKEYDQIGYFKSQLIADSVLINVKSDSGIKQDGVVKTTIEGDLP